MKRWMTLAHLTLLQPPLVMIEAAARSGFDSVGVRICPRRPGDDYFVNLLGATAEARAVRRAASDAGVRLSNVSAYQFYPEVDVDQLLPAVEATAELGSPLLVVNCFDPDRMRFLDRVSAYAAAATSHGITLALEFMPYSRVRTLDDALSVRAQADASNLGLLLDCLHLDRAGGSAADIAALDPDAIAFAQLCDATPARCDATDEEMMREARHARLPLGTGALDVGAFAAALPPGVELEYEVAGLPGDTPAQVAASARADLMAFMGSTEHA